MNSFKYSSVHINSLSQNPQHKFAMNHSMMLYQANALYTLIPKNACSTMRLSVAIANGCIDSTEQGNWIHANNSTFNATLSEACKVDYSFVILRCPFKRLASVFLDKFVAKEPVSWQLRDRLDRKIELDDLTFRDFVSLLDKPSVMNSDIHWRPQVDFLLYKEYSDYFSLENFGRLVINLKNKIDLQVNDARNLTNHGTNNYALVNDICYADIPAFELSVMKRKGQCPSHEALYDKEIYDLVARRYSKDITLYRQKCDPKNLMNLN